MQLENFHTLLLRLALKPLTLNQTLSLTLTLTLTQRLTLSLTPDCYFKLSGVNFCNCVVCIPPHYLIFRQALHKRHWDRWCHPSWKVYIYPLIFLSDFLVGRAPKLGHHTDELHPGLYVNFTSELQSVAGYGRIAPFTASCHGRHHLT